MLRQSPDHWSVADYRSGQHSFADHWSDPDLSLLGPGHGWSRYTLASVVLAQVARSSSATCCHAWANQIITAGEATSVDDGPGIIDAVLPSGEAEE